MKKEFAVVLLLLILQSFAVAQNNKALFRIISCSEGVMIDDQKAAPGLDVFPTSKVISVPPGGYAGVLTEEGYSYEFRRKVRVDEVSEEAFNRKYQPRRWTRPAKGEKKPDIELIGIPGNPYSALHGDSIFFGWSNAGKGIGTISIRYVNLHEDSIAKVHIEKPWEILNVKPFLDDKKALAFGPNKAIMFQVREDRSNQPVADLFLIKRMPQAAIDKLLFDLSRIPVQTTDRKIVEAAIFEINGFHYDQVFLLFKFKKSGKSISDRMCKSYFENFDETYRLSNFEF